MTNNTKRFPSPANPVAVGALFDAAALRELNAATPRARRGGHGRNTVPRFDHIVADLSGLGTEGVDHINVSRRSKTEVGAAFSLENPLPYNDDLLRTTVPSLAAFTMFLKTGMTVPLLLVHRALPRGAEYASNHCRHSLALQAHAIWQKLRHYKQMQVLLCSIQVPIDWYIEEEDGTRRRTVSGAAHAAALIVIRQALIDGEAPDFTDFFDNDVHRWLRALPRLERLVEIERMIQELLLPVADCIEQYKADKAQRPERAPRAPRAKRERKESTVSRLNHMVPTLRGEDLGTPAAPGASAADLPPSGDMNGLYDTLTVIADALPVPQEIARAQESALGAAQRTDISAGDPSEES